MTISSCTPEGEPASCPLCQARVVVQPSLIFGDATCPRCGHLLWILQADDTVRIYVDEQSKVDLHRIRKFMADQLGVSADKLPIDSQTLKDLGADSLFMVELVMELESELDP